MKSLHHGQRPTPQLLRGDDVAQLLHMIRSEEESELSHKRAHADDAEYLQRVAHLKAVNIAHERQISMLTDALAAQHELLHDVNARVTALAAALPSADGLAGTQWHSVVEQILQIRRRLHRGQAARSLSATQSDGFAAPRGVGEIVISRMRAAPASSKRFESDSEAATPLRRVHCAQTGGSLSVASVPSETKGGLAASERGSGGAVRGREGGAQRAWE
mmetsp:Transcript_17414/g.37461  ORF Transcript_17414/g.37461 Transcript_17414/m.37461 type:complete len:218 (+) Transcript_17414:298-951(+)